jgi:hypothetical protein
LQVPLEQPLPVPQFRAGPAQTPEPLQLSLIVQNSPSEQPVPATLLLQADDEVTGLQT